MKVAQALSAAGLAPREARLLLAEATGFSEASVLAHPERELPEEAAQRFTVLAERRRAGEPVAYILGRREFHGLTLAVNPSVLIPRPETELLVDLALQKDPGSVLELGTGCGAVALAIKRARPKANVVAVEASLAALAVARRNATMLGLAVEFRHGRWFEPVAGHRFGLIVANAPYVAENDLHLEQGDLRYEPRSALVAGADGLAAIREIVPQAPAHLVPGGWILLEHGLGQEGFVRSLLAQAKLEAVTTWPDLAGIARVSGAQVKSY
jgi:release factor glutamine methyltransferase